MVPARIGILGPARWRVFVDPGDGYYVGVCDELHAVVDGETWREFNEAAREASKGTLEVLHEGGELEAFLAEKGWKLSGELPRPGEAVEFDLPYELSWTDAGAAV